MQERSERISKLKSDRLSRESYIKAKLVVSVPSQVRALRLKSITPNQKDLAKANETHQSRLSMLEQPGEANVTLETLAWIASIHKVGVIVKFVSFSEMLRWENEFSQDEFNVATIDQDISFLNPVTKATMFSIKTQSTGHKPFPIAGSDGVLRVITNTPDHRSSTMKLLTKVSNG
jgi:hypothetical protein